MVYEKVTSFSFVGLRIEKITFGFRKFYRDDKDKILL